jgi:hypothetical protein
VSFAAAQLAVEVRLATPLGGLLVQWPNGPTIKPDGAAYAEVFHMPANSFVDTLGAHGRDLLPAITQVNLYYPLESGNNQSAVDVDIFRTSFVAGQWLSEEGQAVLVRACSPGPSRRDGSYFKSIVSIQWEARISR